MTEQLKERSERAFTASIGLKRQDLLREQNYIGGVWKNSGAKSLAVTNPATGETIGHIPNFGAGETGQAITAAHLAFQSWRARSARERADVLRRWYMLVMENADDLARLMTAEQGKPLAEAAGEVKYAASFLEWFSEEARRVYGDIIPGHQADKRILVRKEPVGVVAAITPWNFPAAMVTRKLAPALAVGCTVVLKPSELTPFSALALAVLAEEAGLPTGVLNVVTGEAEPIGSTLTADERVRKLTFTGSTAVGKQLTAACAPTLKRVSMELGGNAPFIVFEDANIDQAIEGILASKFRNTGQTCVCANRILVHERIYDKLADGLTAAVRHFKVGNGLEGKMDQGPLINARALEKVERHVADAIGRGATVKAGGHRIEKLAPGYYYEPTVLTDAKPDMLLAREETFGPVAPLFRFRDEKEAIDLANDSSAGLSAYAFTTDLNRFWRVSEQLQCGMVGFNTGLISTEIAPFGGVKESGFGREGSKYGMDDYLSLKYVCIGDVS